jgi:hypothetical protein
MLKPLLQPIIHQSFQWTQSSHIRTLYLTILIQTIKLILLSLSILRYKINLLQTLPKHTRILHIHRCRTTHKEWNYQLCILSNYIPFMSIPFYPPFTLIRTPYSIHQILTSHICLICILCTILMITCHMIHQYFHILIRWIYLMLTIVLKFYPPCTIIWLFTLQCILKQYRTKWTYQKIILCTSHSYTICIPLIICLYLHLVSSSCYLCSYYINWRLTTWFLTHSTPNTLSLIWPTIKWITKWLQSCLYICCKF